MHAIQENAADQWDRVLSELRKNLPLAIEHLRDLEAAIEVPLSSTELGPERWAEPCVEIAQYLLRDEETGVAPEETVRRIAGLVQSALDAGDWLVHFEEF